MKNSFISRAALSARLRLSRIFYLISKNFSKYDPVKSEDSKVFSKIYQNSEWGIGSGPGSYPNNAQEYMKLLQKYFDDPKYTTIIDLGCGDWQMMEHINIPDSKLYKGFDVVAEVIANNKKKFSKKNVEFYHINNLSEFLSKKADLLIIKDVMMHWSNDQIKYFIDKILPNFKSALITNCHSEDGKINYDINTGNFRYLDPTKPPFNLKNTKTILKYKGGGDKIVLLYSKK